jgi:hypothetical protein
MAASVPTVALWLGQADFPWFFVAGAACAWEDGGASFGETWRWAGVHVMSVLCFPRFAMVMVRRWEGICGR